ncbi:MAG TPA: hypothetical protein VFJ29_02935, partial [Candidatus Kapabacteria bacterium]|nr:hypothetical protein [Candidatus Kapabacteria bacterium]
MEVHAGWTQMNMPGSNIIRAFVQNGADIFAGSQGGGVFLSTDNGASWSPRNNGLGNTNVYTLLFQNASLYAGTASGVYVSSDNGASWESRTAGLPSDTAVQSLAAHGAVIIAGTYGGPAFISTNGGVNWINDTSLQASNINALVAHGNSIYAAADGGVYHTTDDGISWKKDTSTTAYTLTIDNNNFYVGGYGEIMVSTDNGATWNKETAGLQGQYVYAIWASGNDLLVGVQNGPVLSSTNGGVTWSTNSNGIPTTFTTYTFFNSGATIFAGNSAGIYQTTLNSGSWSAANSGMISPYIQAVCVDPNNGNIIAATLTGTINISSDNGATWSPAATSMGTYPIFIKMHGNKIFAGSYNGLYSSTNYGSTWLVDTAGFGTKYFTSFFVHNNIEFIGSGKGVFRSTDNGASWQAASNGIASPYVYGFTEIGDSLYAGSDGGVSLSTDNGTSWTTIDSNMPDIYVFRVGSIGHTLFAAAAGNPYRVYSSKNAGGVWRTDTSLFPRNVFMYGFATVNGYVIAASESNGVFFTADSG